jgi:cold shock CspA family protein
VPATKIAANFFTGTIRWYNPTFGYGFITHPNGEDVFFHYTNIASADKMPGKRAVVVSKKTGKVIRPPRSKQLRCGDKVLYEYVETSRGLQAKTVVRA